MRPAPAALAYLNAIRRIDAFGPGGSPHKTNNRTRWLHSWQRRDAVHLYNNQPDCAPIAHPEAISPVLARPRQFCEAVPSSLGGSAQGEGPLPSLMVGGNGQPLVASFPGSDHSRVIRSKGLALSSLATKQEGLGVRAVTADLE